MSDSKLILESQKYSYESVNKRLSLSGLVEACQKQAVSLDDLAFFGNGRTRSGPET